MVFLLQERFAKIPPLYKITMSSKNPPEHSIRKVIIDTDPGIDDAMAIMMALRAHKKGQIDVLAISLVHGNTNVKHAQVNILRILETFQLEDEVVLRYT